MNNQLQRFARDSLKEGLSKCTGDEQQLFKRMYSHEEPYRLLHEVIDNLDESKLDWAMQQVQRTLDKK